VKFKYLVILLLTLTSNIFSTENNFDIHSSLENHTANNTPLKIKWSILIPTIVERAPVFEKLYAELTRQINLLNLAEQIEILYFRDQRGENLVGFKRNLLLEQSLGEYTCFIDDDDLVHEKYIQMVYEKLLENPDCVSLTGIITFDGKEPRKFIHSLKNTRWFNGRDGCYHRPPNHLNPIKRSIAIQFKFPLKNTQEDLDWCMQICNSKLLKIEAEITEPYYFYRFEAANSVQFQTKASNNTASPELIKSNTPQKNHWANWKRPTSH
jgi:hypothetical protein